MYEKRKAAALEIEKMVKDFVSVGNTSQIKKLLKVNIFVTICKQKIIHHFCVKWSTYKTCIFWTMFVFSRHTHDHFTMLQVLGSEFAISQNPHMRKGGLIGASLIFAEIVKPLCLKSILFLLSLSTLNPGQRKNEKSPIPIYWVAEPANQHILQW